MKNCKAGSLKIVLNETRIPLPKASSWFSPPVKMVNLGLGYERIVVVMGHE